MTNDTRNRLILAALVVIALILFVDSNAIRSGLATVQSLASIAFYVLGAYWFFKHLNK